MISIIYSTTTLMFAFVLHTTVPVYTVSFKTQQPLKFNYSSELIVLRQDEWDNEFTKTVGLPRGSSGYRILGYSKLKPKIISEMILDANSEDINKQ